VPKALPGLVRWSGSISSFGSVCSSLVVLPADLTFAKPKSRILACPRSVTKNVRWLDVAVEEKLTLTEPFQVGKAQPGQEVNSSCYGKNP
jgi:hypothetical protein